MKKAILLLVLSTVIFYGYSQDTIQTNAVLLKTLNNMKKPMQTFYLKINFAAYGKANGRDILIRLNNKNLVNKSEYVSSVGFHFLDDTTKYYIPIQENVNEETKEQLINLQNLETIAVLKIKAFKNYLYNNGELFFLIENIEFLNSQ